jgi:signal transduction histidine kinase
LEVVGTTRVRSCCTFVWAQDGRGPRRVVFVRAYHCAACVGEMVRSAKLQRITISGSIAMERVREVLGRQRPQLVDRWERQLRAASEAGFGLDAATAEVLPQLLDAVDRALERRFRAVPRGAEKPSADSRRAAMQCSLLGDFLFDAMVESLPEMSAGEQRLLSDALAHAGVEVLVRLALEREQDKRRREAARLAKLAHELRNSMTAARLSVDLLRRKGVLKEGRAARTLERSLSRLQQGIEDTLLDELLSAGGLKLARVRLAPVLADAHSAAGELGADAKRIRVVLEKIPALLHIEADPRLVRPAVRGLLRAALELARPGSTVRFGAAGSARGTRVAVQVNDCRKLAGKRLPDLPALSFARRAARAHGGSLSLRASQGDGCEFRFVLPSAGGARLQQG